MNSKCEMSTNICLQRHVHTSQSHKELINNVSTRRPNDHKDYSSLKRNLFTEFNSISNIEEHVKKDTVEENSNSQNISNDSKQFLSIKEEQKSNILGCMSPMQDSVKYNASINNSLTPTPLKPNGYYDGKDWIPPYPIFKDHDQKCIGLQNYPPFLNINKSKFSPVENSVMEAHNIQDEICGKKRLRYESYYSNESPQSSNQLYDHYEQDKELR